MVQERIKQTKIGEIPESWEINPFEKSIKKVKIKRNIRIPKSDYLIYGQFPIVDQGQDFISGWTNDSSLLFREELPIIIFGDHTRIFKYIEKPFALGADGTKLIIPTSSYNTKFFYYFLLNQSISSKGYNRHYSLLKEILVPSPPLSEQKKIAAVLSKIQQSIDVKEELIKTTQELKKSIIQYLFTHGTKNEKTKQTEVGEIPGSWDIIKIKATGSIVTGSTPSTKNENFYGGEYNLISPADLDNGKYVQSAHKKLTKAGYQTCTPIPQNSILVGCIGNIGKLGMVNNNYSTTNQQINSIIVNSSHNPDFVYYMLQNCRQRLSQSAAKVTVPILNKKNFENFKIAIPSKISEQNKIASILSKIDERIQNYENQKSALQSLFRSMLNKLMTGQIRVHKLDIDVSEVE